MGGCGLCSDVCCTHLVEKKLCGAKDCEASQRDGKSGHQKSSAELRNEANLAIWEAAQACYDCYEAKNKAQRAAKAYTEARANEIKHFGKTAQEIEYEKRLKAYKAAKARYERCLRNVQARDSAVASAIARATNEAIKKAEKEAKEREEKEERIRLNKEKRIAAEEKYARDIKRTKKSYENAKKESIKIKALQDARHASKLSRVRAADKNFGRQSSKKTWTGSVKQYILNNVFGLGPWDQEDEEINTKRFGPKGQRTTRFRQFLNNVLGIGPWDDENIDDVELANSTKTLVKGTITYTWFFITLFLYFLRFCLKEMIAMKMSHSGSQYTFLPNKFLDIVQAPYKFVMTGEFSRGKKNDSEEDNYGKICIKCGKLRLPDPVPSRARNNCPVKIKPERRMHDLPKEVHKPKFTLLYFKNLLIDLFSHKCEDDKVFGPENGIFYDPFRKTEHYKN